MNHASDAFAVDVKALYGKFDAVGLQYGPAFRMISQAWTGARTVGQFHRRLVWGTEIHPADLDEALQLNAVSFFGSKRSQTQLPFAVGKALLRGTAATSTGRMWASVTKLSVDSSLVGLSHPAGNATARLDDDFKARSLKTGSAPRAADQRRWLYEIEWSPVRDQDAPAEGLRLHVIGHEPTHLVTRTNGHRVVRRDSGHEGEVPSDSCCRGARRALHSPTEPAAHRGL